MSPSWPLGRDSVWDSGLPLCPKLWWLLEDSLIPSADITEQQLCVRSCSVKWVHRDAQDPTALVPMVKEIDASFQTIQEVGGEKRVAYHRWRLVAGKRGTGASQPGLLGEGGGGKEQALPFYLGSRSVPRRREWSKEELGSWEAPPGENLQRTYLISTTLSHELCPRRGLTRVLVGLHAWVQNWVCRASRGLSRSQVRCCQDVPGMPSTCAEAQGEAAGLGVLGAVLQLIGALQDNWCQ